MMDPRCQWRPTMSVHLNCLIHITRTAFVSTVLPISNAGIIVKKYNITFSVKTVDNLFLIRISPIYSIYFCYRILKKSMFGEFRKPFLVSLSKNTLCHECGFKCTAIFCVVWMTFVWNIYQNHECQNCYIIFLSRYLDFLFGIFWQI